MSTIELVDRQTQALKEIRNHLSTLKSEGLSNGWGIRKSKALQSAERKRLRCRGTP